MTMQRVGLSASDDAMRRASRLAYMSVDEQEPGQTYIAVIERFDRETTERDGETYGELWIADEASTDQLTADGVEWQEVDGYGYTV